MWAWCRAVLADVGHEVLCVDVDEAKVQVCAPGAFHL